MNILIVDENEVVRRQLFWALRKGHDLHEAANRSEALSILSRVRPDIILMELIEERDADESAGMALVERLMNEPLPPIILIITRNDRKEVHARLLTLGAMDVFTKPIDAEELRVVLHRAQRLLELRDVAEQLERRPVETRSYGRLKQDPDQPELGILGVDPEIKRILDQIRRIAPTPVSVLITGETGTGKEIFAQAVHKLSERSDQRFVPLNCAVLSDTLVEDELFGHEKGAFTGAIDRRKGKFEFAHKGTLFLDEIGELSPRLQAKFLRVLQERTFERLGGNQAIETDFRLVSATHRDLNQLVKENGFREDLMFRINVVSFHIPPLRERRGDIKLLAEAFLVDYAQAFDRADSLSFSREVVRFMYDYPWPGNVRELKHFVERAVALADGRIIGPEAIPHTFAPTAQGESLVNGKGNFDTLVKKYKRQLVMEALESTGNNKIQSAQLLGISKSYLFKLIKQLAVPG